MNKRSAALLGLGCACSMIGMFLVFQILGLNRAKQVLVRGEVTKPGAVNRVVLQNASFQPVNLTLRCHQKKSDSASTALFQTTVRVKERNDLVLDIHPELAGKPLPIRIANRQCEAFWRGPFGIEKSVWWIDWSFGRPAQKMVFLRDRD